MTVRVAFEWLNSCSGCEIAILDLGERFFEVLNMIELVHMPLIFDQKYYSVMGDGDSLQIPEADIGFISGGVRNEKHLEVAREMRKRCGTIVALGTCATHGGIPAMINSYTNDELLERYYSTEDTDEASGYPEEGLPALLDRCYALDEEIKVDVYLPGCPPHPDQIYQALVALVKGRQPEFKEKSVCDTCPLSRGGNLKKLRRFLEEPEPKDKRGNPLEMKCFLEQGFLCMGPVTRGGCGGEEKIPRCILAGVPCKGCYGPVINDADPRLEILNALVSNDVDISALEEHTSLLRFAGAHGLLRPLRNKGGNEH